MVVVQLVPRLRPAVCGVGDYGLSLARALRDHHGIETQFVLGDPQWRGPKTVEGFRVHTVAARAAPSLLELLSQFPAEWPLLVHYVGFGYHGRGCPLWLSRALDIRRATVGESRIVTMFHEVHPTGVPPWSTSFWLAPAQRHVAARLARTSDACVTSREAFASMIRSLSNGTHSRVPSLPVFSTIGEPDRVPPNLGDRTPRLVVFGSPVNRIPVFSRVGFLERVCRTLGIQEIVDLGAPVDIGRVTIAGIEVQRRGIVSASEASDLLLDSIAGVFDYPTDALAKSTIFAAYCSHRAIPVGWSYTLPSDGLQEGEQWLSERNLPDYSPVVGQRIADAGYTWYLRHCLAVQGEAFADLLRTPAELPAGTARPEQQ